MSTTTVFEKMHSLFQPYREQSAKIDQLRDRRDRLRDQAQAKLRQAEKADLRIAKLAEKLARVNPYARGAVLEPLAQALCEFFPGCTYKIAGPFGLGSTLHLTFASADEAGLHGQVAHGAFRFDNQSESLVMVDFTKPNNSFPPNSVGAANGLNYDTIDITPETELTFIANTMRL